MSVILSGSQNIYKWWFEAVGSGSKIIFTGHAFSLLPGSGFDTPAHCGLAAAIAWGFPIGSLTYGGSTNFTVHCEAVLSRANPGGKFSIPTGIFCGLNTPSFPERSFRIRRVGAGGTTSDKGRIRIGPARGDCFLDPPRFRRVNVAAAPIVAALAYLNTSGSWAGAHFGECLWNRRTGDARPIVAYSCAPYSGAVWQRAGYPQGKRGPDRP